MSKSSNNIVLVGMSGVGKTTVGRLLSKELNKEFIDIDHEFENITKFKIEDFFSEYGEIEFRKIEKKITTNIILNKDNLVISTGGGIFSDIEIRDFIIKNSLTLFLNSNIDTLASRLRKNFINRPLLNKGSLIDNIEKLYKERIEDYMMAEHIVIVDNLSAEQVALKIIEEIY